MVCFGDCNICWIISALLCLINCFKMMNECLHVTDKWQTPTCPRTQSDLIMLFETDFSLKNESPLQVFFHTEQQKWRRMARLS